MSESDALAVAAPPPPTAPRSAPRKKPVSKPPKLSLEHAELTRRLGAGCEAALTALDEDAVLRLQLTEEKSAAFGDPVVLIGAAGPIEFSEGTRLIRALTGIDLGTESDDDQQRWTWLQAALIGRLGNTPFAGTDRMTRTGRPVAAGSILLRVSVRTSRHGFSLLARALPSAWLNVLACANWTTDRRPISDYVNIPYRSPIRIARHVMPAGALQTVAAGDIFLPSGTHFLVDGEGTAELAGVEFRTTYVAPSALKIIAMAGEIDMDQAAKSVDCRDQADAQPDLQPDRTGDPGEFSALEAIPVTLDFEMGHVAMSLGKLRTMGIGSIMALQGGSPAAISIVCKGRALGQGEAVDVNGQLGIRVTHWGDGQ